MQGKLLKVEEDSPDRCQAIAQHGQCVYKAIEGTVYCTMHAGVTQDLVRKEKLRNYRFQQYRERIENKADSGVIKSLREEIGILRVIMEEVVNKCKDDNDLLIYAPRITDLALKIEKVVVSCHKLETSLGHTLDKTAVLTIATRIVSIVSSYITDENTINNIVEEIGKMISEA